MLGSLGGKIIFEVNDQKILNFNKLKQNVNSRWVTHELIMNKAKSEFLGAGLRTLTFDIRLDAHYGVRPRTTLETLERMVEKGVSSVFTIGSKPVGDHKWKIKEMSEAWDIVMNQGELAKANVTLTLEEFVE